jgi:hypothetical protein
MNFNACITQERQQLHLLFHNIQQFKMAHYVAQHAILTYVLMFHHKGKIQKKLVQKLVLH